jgi:hypothetical protein
MQGFGSYSWEGPEIGGVLFGAHEAGSVSVKAHRVLKCEHAEGPAFTLSERDEAELQELLETAKDDPELEGLEAVGWYHSVYQDLYSTRRDILIQERHFPEKWQILLVLRRVKSEPVLAGFYVREHEGLLKLGGLFPPVTADEPEEAPAPPVPAEPDSVAHPKPDEAVETIPATPQPHARVIARLLLGIQSRKGFMLLTAAEGSEKQDLLAALLNRLEDGSTSCAYLADPATDLSSFFTDLAWKFGLVCDADSKPQLLYALNDLLADEASRGRATVLIIDHAERLPAEVLHEIQMFEMLQNRRGKLLQVILCGSPEFADLLDKPEYVDLKHQVGVRCALPSPGFVKYN